MPEECAGKVMHAPDELGQSRRHRHVVGSSHGCDRCKGRLGRSLETGRNELRRERERAPEDVKFAVKGGPSVRDVEIRLMSNGSLTTCTQCCEW